MSFFVSLLALGLFIYCYLWARNIHASLFGILREIDEAERNNHVIRHVFFFKVVGFCLCKFFAFLVLLFILLAGASFVSVVICGARKVLGG
jgi:hypothetical protein